MSKKESEFDRYERMKKLEREVEVEKRKSLESIKKKGGRPKPIAAECCSGTKDWSKVYNMATDEEYIDI